MFAFAKHQQPFGAYSLAASTKDSTPTGTTRSLGKTGIGRKEVTPGFSNTTTFVSAVKCTKEVNSRRRIELRLLDTVQHWKININLDQRLALLLEIIKTSLRPDLIPWSS